MANIINRQQTFSTNGTVTAAGLHNLIDTALVNSAIIKNQQEITSIGTADLLLIAPDSVDASLAPRKVTVQNLLDDGLTAGTFTSFNLTGALTYGTATGNRTVSTTATISTATISTGIITSLTAGTTNSTAATITNGTITTGLIPTLTAGTTTGTAGIFTSGTVATLNSTTGTITNLSTTLAGDFTISQGTGTLGTTGATLGTYGGSTSVPVLAINAKGQVTSTGTAAITSGLTGFRNRIINGDMRIRQRGDSGTLAGSVAYLTIDRWAARYTGASGGVFNGGIANAPTGFQYSAQIGRGSGVTATGVIELLYAMETTDSIPLQGKNVTLSFYAKAGTNFSSSGNNLNLAMYCAKGTDQSASLMGAWTSLTTPISQTQAITTSWVRYSFSGAVPSDCTQIGLYFYYTTNGTAGADDKFYITGVQLEAGSTATDFERRPIGTELALCQRYFQKTYDIETAQATATNLGMVYVGSTAAVVWGLGGAQYIFNMRSIPSINYWDGAGNASKCSYIVNNSGSTSFVANTNLNSAPYNISTRGFLVGSNIVANSGSYIHYTANSEL